MGHHGALAPDFPVGEHGRARDDAPAVTVGEEEVACAEDFARADEVAQGGALPELGDTASEGSEGIHPFFYTFRDKKSGIWEFPGKRGRVLLCESHDCDNWMFVR